MIFKIQHYPLNTATSYYKHVYGQIGSFSRKMYMKCKLTVQKTGSRTATDFNINYFRNAVISMLSAPDKMG